MACYGDAVKRHAPATERNRDPILAVLRDELPARGVVLEIASGTGQHAVHFARALPQLTWQPSDLDDDARRSIEAWREEAGLPNLAPPLVLDVTAAPAAWPVAAADAIVCANMVHIAPWQASLGLLDGAAHLLAPGAPLITYGPYRFEGRFTAPSNQAFDASLRARDPAWGVRDLGELAREAARRGLLLASIRALPANNHVVVYRRASTKSA